MIRISAEARGKALASIETTLELFVFPFLKPREISACLSHLKWMQRQPGQMNVQCSFSTNVANQSTLIGIQVTFGEAPQRILNA